MDANKYKQQYAREHYKRVPLDLKPEEYDRLKAAAAQAGEPVNAYVKKAIEERIGAQE